MGTHLGNVIVGAGSVVHGSFLDNVVIARNPAKIICTLDEHYAKRSSKTKNEDLNCAKKYYDVYGKLPKSSDLNEFKLLFTPREETAVEKYGIQFKCNGDETSEVIDSFYKTEPI